eukprot:2544584-Amphidinium_carterae.1
MVCRELSAKRSCPSKPATVHLFGFCLQFREWADAYSTSLLLWCRYLDVRLASKLIVSTASFRSNVGMRECGHKDCLCQTLWL